MEELLVLAEELDRPGCSMECSRTVAGFLRLLYEILADDGD